MKRFGHYILIVLLLLSFIRFVPVVRAEYVLPYPSYMPGNKMYKISRIIDVIRKFWNWGGIGATKYHMELTDKYLVEAKTLFEYKQYLLASDALRRSDSQVAQIPSSLQKVRAEGIDTTQLKSMLKEEMQVHITVLANLKQQLPDQFLWRPEKENESHIEIGKLLDESELVRVKVRDYTPL